MNASTRKTAPVAGRAQRRGAGRTVLRFMWKSQPRRMLLGAVLAACTGIMGNALLGLSGWLITATAIAGLSAATVLLFDVFMPSAGIRLLALGRTGSRYAERLVTHDATLGILARLRGQLFRGWAAPGAAQALQLRPARLLFRLTGDLDALQTLYLRLLVPLTAAVLVAAFTALSIGWIHLWGGVAAGCWLLLTGLGVAWWMLRRSVRTSARSAQALERLRTQAVDLVAGQADLLMAGQLPQQRRRLLYADERLTEQELALNRTEVWGNGAAGVVQAVSLALALAASAWLVRGGGASAAAATFILLLVLFSSEPFAALRRGALEAGRSVLAARRIAPGLQEQGGDGRPPLPSSPHEVLRLEDVSHVYAPGAVRPLGALQHVSLCLQRGGRLAVVGGSGSGKSTLLGLVAGELALQHGHVYAQPACWLTQRSELFQDTVRGNLDPAQRHPDDAGLWRALEQAGLAEVIRNSSGGLDTFLGEGGLGLSGGQARRLALARLLLSGSDFWLLDEPTEGLDAATAADVLLRLAGQARQKTLVVVTHLQRETALATEIMVLRQGRVTGTARRGTVEFEAAVAQLRPG